VDERVVLQGVHMLMGTDLGTRWEKDEARESCVVFIGKNLPKEFIVDGLARCLLPAETVALPERDASPKIPIKNCWCPPANSSRAAW
jgi:hypothetical protein